MKLLIDHGADVNHQIYASCRDSNLNCVPTPGWTALMIASAEGHSEAVKILLESDADPNMVNQYGRTALMFAAKYGFTSIVRELIKHGANINAVPTDNTGWPALIVAAGEGKIEVVKLLLELHADTTIKDKEGSTALEWARKKKHKEIVSLLENK